MKMVSVAGRILIMHYHLLGLQAANIARARAVSYVALFCSAFLSVLMILCLIPEGCDFG